MPQPATPQVNGKLQAVARVPQGYPSPPPSPNNQLQPNNVPPHLRRGIVQPTPAPAQKNPADIKPWDIDPSFPNPNNREEINYRYDRKWTEDPRRLFEGPLRRAKEPLPQLFSDDSWEELETKREKYISNGNEQLFEIRQRALTSPVASRPEPVEYRDLENGDVSPATLAGILAVGEIATKIVKYLAPSIRDTACLSVSSKQIGHLVSRTCEFWDSSTGVFDHDRFVEKVNEQGKVMQTGRGVRSDLLVVTRLGKIPPSQTLPYDNMFSSHMSLLLTVTKVKSSFRYLCLDQLPFLDLGTIELMIRAMPNLETLSISRCVMLDFSKLPDLIDIIKRNPRQGGGPKYIKVDFAPFYFEGPNSSKRQGSYGLTWNEPTFHTPKAVVALLIRCHKDAKEIGMDLLGESSSFFSFVRRLPGPDVLWAVKAREALIAWMDAHSGGESEATREKHQAVADDLMAALVGDGFEPPESPSEVRRTSGKDFDKFGWWAREYTCNTCKTVLPRAVTTNDIRGCWGCKARRFVDLMEFSHMRNFLMEVGIILHRRREVRCESIEDIFMGPESITKAYDIIELMDSSRAALMDPEHFSKHKKPSPMVPPSELEPGLHEALVRYCWKDQVPKEPFDFLLGGPQFQNPGKLRVTVTEGGGQTRSEFNTHWKYTGFSELCYRKWLQNERYKDPMPLNIYCLFKLANRNPKLNRKSKDVCRLIRWIEAGVVSKLDSRHLQNHCREIHELLWVLHTPGQLPFSHDYKWPDKRIDSVGYYTLVHNEQFQLPRYGLKNAFQTFE
ncbi:hypothetical protein QBC35DRAFT_374724 [Podospora australis]|uniref:Uncharacterized protein n=1 Tax=Podospora australis TaxID=1536484 RepID=A0AAN7AM86_9PEZI|nr:hypothetical protein QBC35DRAFT_374724 [Podospora australis]